MDLFTYYPNLVKLSETDLTFPDPALAHQDGTLAIGGDLSVERLMLGYEKGIFPWFGPSDPILWTSPHRRCVIYPAQIRISKSMRQVLKSNIFTITANKAFAQVIAHCANIPRDGEYGTWITGSMQEAYIALHNRGFAHSIEVWQNGTLVGGLYGVKIKNVFCGESMFSRVSNASKTALIYVCQEMGFDLIDCQMYTEHLMSMGARMIDREDYLKILNKE
jgi:leucyl/phenylalanyl-tRNA--protein transferase